MSATKAHTVLDDDVTLTAGAGDHTSSIGSINTGYGAVMNVEIINGGTGPTVSAKAQVWTSPDNTNWHKHGGVIDGGTANNGGVDVPVEFSVGYQYVKVVSGSNTNQDVVIRVDISNATALS